MSWRCIVIEEDPTQSVELCKDMLRTIFIQCSSWSHRICFAVISQSSFCTSCVHVNPNVVNDWVGSALSSHGIYRPHMLSTALHCFLEFVCVWLQYRSLSLIVSVHFKWLLFAGAEIEPRRVGSTYRGEKSGLQRSGLYRDQCSTKTSVQRPVLYTDHCNMLNCHVFRKFKLWDNLFHFYLPHSLGEW